MKVFHDIQGFQPPREGVVLTIGNFDGVHLGHRLIVETALDHARKPGVLAAALTFEPHPLTVVAPRRVPARLTTLEEKLALLERLGLDATIVVASSRELLDKSADEFLRNLTNTCRPRAVVEGPTFNFGRGREGSINTLIEGSARYGFETVIVEEVRAAELDGAPEINSSCIRRAVGAGRVEDAKVMLGRPHRVTGVVGDGKHLGDSIGFPTANLDEIPQLLPAHAVYAAVAQLDDGTFHLAAVNVGPQPTFDDSHTRVEAYLLDYDGRLRGRKMGLHFLAKLRDQVCFDGAGSLTAQLRRDVEQTHLHARAVSAARSEAIPLA